MEIRSPIGLITVAAGLLLQAGCVSSPPPPKTSASDFESMNMPPGQTAIPDEVLGTDPSAVRLQDIGGDFLLYMRINKQMPATLQDLSTVDGQGNAASFNAPASGQPYVYVSTGLWLSGHSQDIVVYDPALTKQSRRWCLFLGAPQPNGSVSVDVVALPESVFQQYKPKGS
jgi:hypothetical protein